MQGWVRDSGRDPAPAVLRGIEVWKQNGCAACHVPFCEGPNLAPDLSCRAVDRSVPALRAVLEEGRGRMPSSLMMPEEIEELNAYLEWFAAHRADLVELNDRMLKREKFSWSRIPWFEYP